MRTQIRANRPYIFRRSIDLYVGEFDEFGALTAACEPLTLKKLSREQVEDQVVVEGPTLTIGIDAAQTLIDELWQCGLRPSEGSGSAGSLAATEKHLKDLQRIVFKSYPG